MPGISPLWQRGDKGGFIGLVDIFLKNDLQHSVIARMLLKAGDEAISLEYQSPGDCFSAIAAILL